MSQTGLGSVTANGFCNSLYTASADATAYVVKYSKIAGGTALDALKKVATLAKAFFTILGGYLKKGIDFTKGHVANGFHMAKDFTMKNPRAVAIAGIAFAGGSAMTAIFTRCCGKGEGAEEEAPEQLAGSQAPQNAPVNADVQPPVQPQQGGLNPPVN